MIRWDEAFYILVVWYVVLSPALLALPWAWFTRTPKVRKILLRAFVLILATPILAASVFAFFTYLCVRGGIDQQFAQCGFIPDWLASLGIIAAMYLLVFIASLAALYCIFLEIRRWRHSS